MLIKFYDVLNDAVDELAINKVTDFIYEICVKVQENYKKYRIVGDENMESRIILCEAIRKVLERSFFFVGIVPIEKIWSFTHKHTYHHQYYINHVKKM